MRRVRRLLSSWGRPCPEAGFGRGGARPSLLLPVLAALFAASPVTAQVTAPSVPRNVSVTPGNDTLTLTWQAPSSWGSWTAAGFIVEWKRSQDGSNSWSVVKLDGTVHVPGPTDTSFKFAGPQEDQLFSTIYTVTNGTSYDLRIQAYTQQPGTDGSQDAHWRYSSWVTVANKIPIGPPEAPDSVSVTPGAGRLGVSWTAPATGGSAITGYDVQYKTWNAPESTGTGSDPTTGWIAATHAGTTATATVTGLTGSEPYYAVRVRAVNAQGNGPWASEPVWSARLTVGSSLGIAGIIGCRSQSGSTHTCSSTSNLTDNSFTIGTLDYEVRTIGDASDGLVFHTSPSTASSGMTLCVDDTAYAIANAVDWRSIGVRWAGVDAGWSVGDRVILRLQQSSSCGGVTAAGPVVQFASTDSPGRTVLEGITARIRLRVKPAPTSSLTVALGHTAGTATAATGSTCEAGADYVPPPSTVTVAAGDTLSSEFSVRTCGDQLVESDETFTMTIGSGTGYTVGSASGSEVIVRDGTLTVSLSASPNPVAEGSGVTVTATRSAQGPAATIPVTVTRGTSEAGDHGTITGIGLSAGATTGTATIATNQDADADDETFTVALGSSLPSVHAAGSPSSVEVTITDDEEPSVTNLAATPGDGKLTVTWTNPSGAGTGTTDVSIRWREQGTSAWTSPGSSLAGSTTSFEITGLTNDRTYEVEVQLFWASSNSGSSWASTTGTPQAPPTVSLSASPNPVAEGSAVTITATLSKAQASNVSIPVTITAGTAESGDYTVGANAVTVTAGNLEGSATLIQTNQDTDPNNETFTVALGSPLPAPLTAGSPSSVEVRINDAGALNVTLSASRNPVAEGETAVLTARLSKPAPAGGVAVSFWTPGGTASQNGDFKLEPARADNSGDRTADIVIREGARLAVGQVVIVADDEAEEDETIVVTVIGPWTDAAPEVTLTIPANEAGPPPLTLAASRLRPAEGSRVVLTATLRDPAPAGGVTATFFANGVGGSPAVAGLDYTLDPAHPSGSANATADVVIRAGQRRAVATLSVVDDDEREGDETIEVTVATTPSTYTDPTVMLTIPANDDGPLTVRLEAEPNPVPEGGSVTVTAHLSAPAAAALAVPVTVTRGTSEAGDHGTLAEIAVAAGARYGEGTISTNQDSDADDETFTVALGTLPSTLRAGSPGSVEVTISDIDTPVVWLEAEPNPVDEGEEVTVTAHVAPALAGAVTIPVRTVRVTSESGDHGTLSRIRIAAGETAGAGTISTNQDSDADDETFSVVLGSLPSTVRAGDPDEVEVTIADDDEPGPEVRLDAYPNPVDEGDTVTVEARLSEVLGSAVTIPVRTVRGTSESGDHGTLSRIRIAAGEAVGEGRIWTARDSDADDETFSVVLGSLPSSVSAGSPDEVEITIAEVGAPEVWLEAQPNPVAEGDTVTVEAWLSEALEDAVTIPVRTARGTSESGDHGTLSRIRIAAGEAVGEGRIWTARDSDGEDETFTVRLGSPPSPLRAGSPDEVEITVADDGGGSAPGAPRSLRVTAGDARLDLTWTAPSSGSPTDYTVEYRERGASDWAGVAESDYTDTEAVIDGLANGTRYDVRVQGWNEHGPGAWASGSGTPTSGKGSSADLRRLTVRASATENGTYRTLGLSPSFRSSVTTYKTATAPAGTEYLKLTPTAADADATIIVDAHEVASGSASPAIQVGHGSIIWVAVISEDQNAYKEYSVDVQVAQASMDAARSAAAVDAALAIVGRLSPEDAAGALLDGRGLGAERAEALDRLGNGNGRYDLGDLLAWIERCERGGARCGNPPRTTPPASDAALPGAIGAAAAKGRPRRRGSGGRRPKRRRPRTGMFAVLLAAALWSCDGAGGPTATVVPEPGLLAVEWTAPAGGPAAAGALVELDGPHVGDARAPGLELYESGEGDGPRRFVVAGGLRDGTVLEFHVPDRRLAGLYSVRVVEVAGEDHRLLEPDDYRAAIAAN